MNRLLSAAAAFAVAMPFAAPAGVSQAAVAVTFGSRDGGAAAFDSIVTSGGGTVSTLSLGAFGSASALLLPGGITLTRNNGGTLSDQGVYSWPGSTATQFTSGHTINISPSGSGRGVGAIGSGVTFDFSAPVNSFGFEVGDWGTCCQPSALYISFDGGAPIQVGLSTSYGDVFETDDAPIVFVGAFDDSGSFSKVQFWGDGFGEYLVIGGTLRSANLDFGTIGDGSSFDRPLLPFTVDTGTGGFQFAFAVQPEQPIVIDPDVAVGYIFEIESGPAGSYFETVEWENLGDLDGYDIYDLSDNLILADFMAGLGQVLNFESLGFTGLQGFKVLDIEESLMLDPTSAIAFKTKLTFDGFTGTGQFQVSQTPITTFVPDVAVPEPSTWALLIGGFGLVGATLRRRAVARA